MTQKAYFRSANGIYEYDGETIQEVMKSIPRLRHKWETHSITEVNGAGVQTEYWQTCSRCGDVRTQYDAPEHVWCPAIPAKLPSSHSPEKS